jgi:predicted methyltransferase
MLFFSAASVGRPFALLCAALVASALWTVATAARDETCSVTYGNFTFTSANWAALFPNDSADFDEEVATIVRLLELEPGMTVCDVGAGAGAYLRAIAPAVMPGGHLISTGAACPEVEAQRIALRQLDPTAEAYMGTASTTGLAPGACDRIYLRMSYHMIAWPQEYMRGFHAALRAGGTMLVMDHAPDNASVTTREGAFHYTMPVVPMRVEIDEARAAGFELRRSVPTWRWFSNGYALLLSK